ncbi:hypothetical protein JMK10_15330 [Rhodovulum sulfidophilum]|uniref:four-carbon acid sugar kinase family protein n=1 Tax=Rhodovulum sulfidophilum TaxID=35806 RepID=UPI001924F89E|nr:four-carbon acid sugar kinase family protein [Rhodovulum sulfidophilum]MBL3574474.1 hypothetical protein [Rhodovulum sulfidophilum]MCE8432710.1 hypothetical protein [Rhodovulum sulfidophilum]MCF4118149.1 hypothetical protein [Rhodovulum sulfidophilum]
MTPPRLLIVADDLTGALDSAGEAASLGIGTRVFLSPAALAAARECTLPPVVAVTTGSRDGTVAAAAAAMHNVCACLSWLRPERVMKKVDSRLKGHVAVECAILADALHRRQIIAAPALPDMGRVQRHGRLTGAGIETPLDIAARFSGLSPHVPDITDAAQMKEAAELDGLPVGARSLAAALVAQLWPDATRQGTPPLPGPAVLAIGSRDPITLAQVERLDLPLYLAPDGRLPLDPPRPPCVMQMVSGGMDRSAAEAGADFAEGLTKMIMRDAVGTLIACGGETAAAILARLGVDRAEVFGLALPGIAVVRAALPGSRVLTIVTKSGGFGAADMLAQLVNLVDNRPTPTEVRKYRTRE